MRKTATATASPPQRICLAVDLICVAELCETTKILWYEGEAGEPMLGLRQDARVTVLTSLMPILKGKLQPGIQGKIKIADTSEKARDRAGAVEKSTIGPDWFRGHIVEIAK